MRAGKNCSGAHHIVLEMFWHEKVGSMRSAAMASSSMRVSGFGVYPKVAYAHICEEHSQRVSRDSFRDHKHQQPEVMGGEAISILRKIQARWRKCVSVTGKERESTPSCKGHVPGDTSKSMRRDARQREAKQCDPYFNILHLPEVVVHLR